MSLVDGSIKNIQQRLNYFEELPFWSFILIVGFSGILSYKVIKLYQLKRQKNKCIMIDKENQDKIQSVINSKEYFEKDFQTKFPCNYLNNFSPIGTKDKDRIKFKEVFQSLQANNYNPQKLQLSSKQSRAIGCMLGMAICDALGASTQFQPYKRNGYGLIKNSFSDIKKAINQGRLGSRHGKVGIWTDDVSMGLAMGYGLIFNNYVFNPILTRHMFHLWWNHGLGNGGRDHSIGLGGNISISMADFQNNPQQQYTIQGKQNNNGNGSLMRLAPIPIAFHTDIKKAGQVAEKQSRTTHNGLQAKECARLMTEIIVNLINRKENQNGKEVLLRTCDNFYSQVKSVMCLAKSQKQTQQMFNECLKDPDFRKFNKTIEDRNWNWKDENFEYSTTRLKQNSGYIGSYCMDGLAMALHIVYHTNSFKQCAIRNADIGGDCDTVGSIAGQIAGAIYGIDSQMLRLYCQMQDCVNKRYEVFLCGYKLFHNKTLQLKQEKQVKKVKQIDPFFALKESENKQD